MSSRGCAGAGLPPGQMCLIHHERLLATAGALKVVGLGQGVAIGDGRGEVEGGFWRGVTVWRGGLRPSLIGG